MDGGEEKTEGRRDVKQEADAKRCQGKEEEVNPWWEKERQRGYSGRNVGGGREVVGKKGRNNVQIRKEGRHDPVDLTQSGAAKTRSREEAGWIGMEGGQGSKARRKDDPERQNRDRDRDREAGKPSSGEAERQRAMSWEMHRLDLLSLDPLLFPRARGW